MKNLETLNSIFCEVFSVEESALNSDFNNTSVEEWDSVHQLTLTSSIEDAFDIMFDPEDILGMTSYDAVIRILNKKYEISIV